MAAPGDYNDYLNWIVYAVVGDMSSADSLLRKNGAAIRSVARHLQQTKKPKIQTLYRGLLLEPEAVEERAIDQDPHVTFVSFSEDRDVACWFADPKSEMSSYVKKIRPRVEGWIMEYKPRLSDILFHYSWNPLVFAGRSIHLEHAAGMNPTVPADQFAWNLRTQREVIVEPLRRGTAVEAYELLDCPEGLDDRLTFPPARGQSY
jgi:hypothetical protein